MNETIDTALDVSRETHVEIFEESDASFDEEAGTPPPDVQSIPTAKSQKDARNSRKVSAGSVACWSAVLVVFALALSLGLLANNEVRGHKVSNNNVQDADSVPHRSNDLKPETILSALSESHSPSDYPSGIPSSIPTTDPSMSPSTAPSSSPSLIPTVRRNLLALCQVSICLDAAHASFFLSDRQCHQMSPRRLQHRSPLHPRPFHTCTETCQLSVQTWA